MAELPKKIQKYTILEKLEESNYAIIYKAQAQKAEPVVLKISRTQETNELISREFLILSQFKHPNIVAVFDYGVTDDGRAYFIQEYIPEPPLNTCFRGYSEDFLGAIVQVANGLGAFHNKGFIHCDLKPEHILYNRNDKRAVLIDFGFAGAATQEVKLAGTMGYMAPEVLKGVGIDQRSDLYSLGVIIYEIIAGTKPKDPYEPIKGIPEEINKLISRLVSKEPALRPSVPELYEILSKNLKTRTVETLSYKVALPETGFVELPEIMERLSSAKGETLIIQGDTGSGKTRLLQELKYKYLMKGYAVLYYLSREKTHLHEALQSFINMKPLDLTGKENKFQIFEEITEALITYAKDKQVIIMVDDLEGLSDYSLRLFRYIGYGLKDTNIVVLGTSHGEEQITTLGFETLSLRPFDQAETQTLLDKTFFEIHVATEETTQKTDFAQWLHKQSGGNPLFVVEILKTLYKNDALAYEANKWQVKIDTLKEIVIPSKLNDMLNLHLLTLDEIETHILKVLSLIEYPLEPSTISLVLEADATFGIEHLKTLGMIREEAVNNKRFVLIANQVLTETVKDHRTRDEKKLLFQSLLKVLESTVADDKDYAPLLAQLSDVLGNKEKAYKYYKIAAKDAEEVYDYESGIRYYEKLTRYSKDFEPNKYPEYLVKLGNLNQTLGDNKSAIEYYNTALESNTKELVPRIYARLGEINATIGNNDEAARYFHKAMDLIDQNTAEYIYLANQLGYVFLDLLKFDEAENILSKSLSLSKKLNNVKTEIDTLYYQASIEWYRKNYDRGIKITRDLLQICEQRELVMDYAQCATLLSSLYQQDGDFENAYRYLDLAIDRFSRVKHTNAFADALSRKALLDMDSGEFHTAQKMAEEALVRSQQFDNRHLQHINLGNLAIIYENLGEFDDAIDSNKRSLQIDPNYALFSFNLALEYYKRGELAKAHSLLRSKSDSKDEPLYYIGLALVTLAHRSKAEAENLLDKGLDFVEKQKTDISTKIEACLKAAQCYYEMDDFGKSLEYARKVQELTHPMGKEYNMAGAFIDINDFNLRQINKIDMTRELQRLKDIGCVYDYAYLKKIEIESRLRTRIKQAEMKEVIETLSAVREIFESLGAGLELMRTRELQEKLFPIIAKDYSQRMISNQYLTTLSRLAELISSNLGDEQFIQNILDLVIKATNAERGALFMNTPQGMEFVAGRDIDQTTINDASELSLTAIEQIDKNKIVFAQDALSDPEFNIKKSVMLNQIRSLLCIPLSVSGNIIGALYADSKVASDIFGTQDKDFLVTVSKILASVIEKSIAFRAMSEENILLKSNIIQDIGSGYLMGKSRTMAAIYKTVDGVAETNSPVLLLGETGTGKGMIARLIHMKSRRKDKKFHTINCGTIAETLLESELFGHKKGSFTGAISDKQGLLEGGEGGTIFLDEISNTSLSFQGKLLEAIEEKKIRRVGETTTRSIDVRFLFATNKDLEVEIEDGRFRSDLFYRINVFKIEVPPLRERTGDIPLLAQFFLEKYSKEISKRIDGFTPEALQRLRDYMWPGNVRELQNVIERAVVLTKSRLITPEDIGFEKVKEAKIVPLTDIKREVIIEALQISNWNVKKAAESLGIGRRSIYRYIKKYNIARDSTRTINTHQ